MDVRIAGPEIEPRRARFVRRMLVLNLAALVAAYMSGQWDAALHAQRAVDTFWYPPHVGIYFAIFAAAVLAVAGLVVAFRSPGTIRERIRGNAALVALAVANLIGFTGAPFDAWWHETYGIDLSVWSPPHFHLLFGMVFAALACSVYFLDAGPVSRGIRPLRAFTRRPVIGAAAIALGLLLAAYLFFEYEAGLANAEVRGRPPWTYPVLWAAFSGFAVSLPAAALRFRGVATFVAMTYVLARLAVIAVDRAVLGFPGAIPYPLVVPAVVFDVGIALAWPRWGARWPSMTVAVLGFASAGVVALTSPPFWSWVGVVPELNAAPWADGWPPALVAGALGALAGWWTGTGLRRIRPSSGPSGEVDAPSSRPRAVPAETHGP